MKVPDITRRAVKNLRQAKGRTLLTSLAIAVGAFTLTLSLALGQGMRDYTDTALKSNMNPQAIYVAKDKAVVSFNSGEMGALKEYDPQSTSMYGTTFKTLSQDDIGKIETVANVERVDPYYTIQTQYVKFEGSDKKYTSEVNLYDPSVLVSTAAGSLPALNQQIGDSEAIIPESYLTALDKKPEEMIGKKVTLHLVKTGKQPTDEEVQTALMNGGQEAVERLFNAEERNVEVTVRAVSRKSSTSFIASNAVFISKAKAAEITNFLTSGTDQFEKYIQATAIVKDGVSLDTVNTALKDAGYHTMTAEEMQSAMFQMVNIIQAIVVGFGLLALIASVFGIVNTMYISVLERTSQIGLMKALGMSRRAVAKLFRYEAGWIGLLGGLIGVGLAYVAGLALNPWLAGLMSLDKGTALLNFVWWQIVALVVFLIIIAIISGWLPSRKAAKLDPIEALRTE